MIVYKMQNKINGKVYIGCTSLSLKSRFQCHWYKKQNTSELNRDLHYYGKDAFTIEEIAQVDTKKEALELESMCMGVFDSVQPNGYNIYVAPTFGWLHAKVKKDMNVETL